MSWNGLAHLHSPAAFCPELVGRDQEAQELEHELAAAAAPQVPAPAR